MCNEVYNNILPLVFKDGQRLKLYKFGIFIIDDIVEHLGYNLYGNKWKEILDILIKFTLHDKFFLRHAAVWGIGKFCENTPNEIFVNYKDLIYEILIKAYNIPKGKEKKRLYDSQRDNIISALGRYIKFQFPVIDTNVALVSWLDMLPLIEDDE